MTTCLYKLQATFSFIIVFFCALGLSSGKPLFQSTISPLGIKDDVHAFQEGVYVYTSLVEWKTDLLIDTKKLGNHSETDVTLNFLAKSAYNEYQLHLGRAGRPDHQDRFCASSEFRATVITILAVQNSASSTETPKTVLFISSSAKGNRLFYSTRDMSPPDLTLDAEIRSCGAEHRNNAACGEINAILLYFNWASHQNMSIEQKKRHLRGSKAITWGRPPVRLDKWTQAAQTRFDDLPNGEYKSACSANPDPGKTQFFGCNAVLHRFGIKEVPKILESDWGQTLFQEGDIVTKHNVSVLPSNYTRSNLDDNQRVRRGLSAQLAQDRSRATELLP
ncbi:MAG: hypothetical protein M1820_002281 [Bogoriella megaspora]|nr:MAG: hypothetical protein M1820_002281 [Bogoriella megaspora]